jgi:uncharacterized protein YbjQ (UPF0145 family)
MIVSTSESLAGKKIVRVLGLTKGNSIRCTHVGTDIKAMLQNLVGGEINEYTAMIAQARDQAVDRMVDQAREMGANAIVAMRFSTTEVMHGAAEILAYGTAVWAEDASESRSS